MGKFKKVASFCLALTMVFTMFAGAKNTATYTDSEKFKTTVGQDSAAILSSLGVIHGFPDGTFRPGQSVTRAELAKMLYIIKTGSDADVPFLGDVDMSRTFRDVYKGHWASKYINYCHLNGIIAGYGDGTFRPEQAVTAAEAAKMILVALGYSPKTEGLEGGAYYANTLRLAQQNGLLKDLFGNFSQSSNRENAVIMLNNALFADTVMYVGGVAVPRTASLASQDTITLAEEGFDLLDATGILVANDEVSLGAYHIDAVTNNETPYKDYSVAADGTSNFVFKNYYANSTGAYARTLLRVNYDASFDQLGREYRLLVTKPGNSDHAVTIYGEPMETAANSVTKTGSANVKKTTIDKLYGASAAASTAIDKTVFLNGKAASFADVKAALQNNTNASVTVVSNDGNSASVEYIFASTQNIGLVSEITDSGMTISGIDMGTIKNENLNFDGDKPQKGDYVVASRNAANGIWTVKKLEKVTGQITAYDSVNNSYRIGDNYYKKSDLMPADDSELMGSGNAAIAGAVLTYWADVDGDSRFIVRAAMNENTSYSQYGLFLWSDVNNKPYQYHTVKFMTQNNGVEYRQVATINGIAATAADLTNLFDEGTVFAYVLDDENFIHMMSVSGMSDTANMVYDRVTDTFSDVNAGYAPYKHANGTIFVTYGQPADGSQEQFKWKAFSGGEFKTAMVNINEAKVAANVLTSVEPNVVMPDRIKSSIIGGVHNIEVASLSFDDYKKFGYLLPGFNVNESTETLATVLSTAIALENGKYVYTIKYADKNGTGTLTSETIGYAAPIAAIKIGHVYKLALNGEGKITSMSEYKVNTSLNNDGIEKAAYTVDTIYKTADGKYQLSVKKLVASGGKPYYDTINVTVDPAKTNLYFVNGMFTSTPSMWDRNKLPVAGTAVNNENFRVWIDFDASNHEIYNIWIDSAPAAEYAAVTLKGIVPTTVTFKDGIFTYSFADTRSVATTYSTMIPAETLIAYGEEGSEFALTAGESYDMVVKGNVCIDILD